MELETYKKAKEIQDRINEIHHLYDGLSIVRDFNKVEMKIYFRAFGEEGTHAYFVPSYIANEICAKIRQDLRCFEAHLTEDFQKL